MDVEALPVDEVAAHLKWKPAMVPPIAAALDNWTDARRSLDLADPNWKTLGAVARGLDADPLRDRFRASWGKPLTPQLQAELKQLAESIDLKSQGPATLILLVAALNNARLPDLALRIAQRSQFVHPADFWLNLQLGNLYFAYKEYGLQQVYGSVAVSLRPESVAALVDPRLRPDKAGGARSGHRLLPEGHRARPVKYALAHNNLGTIYLDENKLEEAIVCFHRAIELDPKGSMALSNLGSVYTQQNSMRRKPSPAFKKPLKITRKTRKLSTYLARPLPNSTGGSRPLPATARQLNSTPLSRTLTATSAPPCSSRGKWTEAIACFRKAIKLRA